MSHKFQYRSYQSELMDLPEVPGELIINNLHELDFLGRTLGGHAATISGMKKLITDKSRLYYIADLGCGSGDAMKCIASWARINNYKVRITGVDKNDCVIQHIRNSCEDYPEIKCIKSDYLDYLKNAEPIDIIHCSLFCHHLADEQLIELFAYCKQCLRTGFIVNDVRRTRLAYYSVWLLTRLFKGSELATNDGPLSVLRGFKKKELEKLLQVTRINNYTIEKKWAFRYLVIGKTN